MQQSLPAAPRLFWMLILLGAGIGDTSALADESPVRPQDNYRVLEWKDLIPEGWEPPLVTTAYNEVTAASVDQASVVQALDRQLVALPGYMKPVMFEGNRVSEFVLVPFLPHQLQAHAHLKPNQMVYVYPLEPLVVEQPFEPIWIVGALSLESVMTDEGPAGYRMIEAVTTPYEY